MTLCSRNRCTALALLALAAAPLGAQIPDSLPNASQLSPERARQLLQSRPELAAQLRDRIGASGLTPDQVRERLRQNGYPADLLDPYLAGADSTKAGHPDGQTVEALQMLGVVSADDAAGLRRAVTTPPAVPASAPAVADTVQVFGLDVFRPGTTQFQPTLGGPVGDNYLLGPGDVLALILTGQVELAHTLEVNREGFIVIPQVGQVYVANQTLAQLRDLLYSKLAQKYSGISRAPDAATKMQLSVGRLRSAQLFVVGDVAHPGAYDVSGSGTVLTALYAAGGPTARGSFRQVQVRRGDSLLGTVDLYDYLLAGKNRSDLKLATGDVVFVPPVGAQVKVTGEVLRPAIYELAPGETLRNLIQAAGGFTAEASRARVQIHRVLPPDARGTGGGRDRVVIDVATPALREGFGPPYPMQAGDSLVVFPIAGRQRTRVGVHGAVWLDGNIGFTPGMRLSDAIRLAGGPKPDVYLGEVLISRLRPDSTRVMLRSTLADSTGRPEPDLALQEDDEIQLFGRTGFRDERYVVVTGAVRAAGRIPWREGMTLRDAVLLAQGLRDEALLTEAEIARMPPDHGNGALAVTTRVPLDSTYLIDRGRDGRYAGPPGVAAPAAGAPEVPLLPYDNVLILRQPQWEIPRTVFIGGQVEYPGRYALHSRADRLADLLHRAGGLTKEAYPAGIVFERTLDNEGRIGLDLPAVLANQHFRDNILLQAGDSIMIPEYIPVVRITGAVNAAISVSYVPGKNLDYYAAAAGGYTRQADRGRAFVTQPDGKVQSVSRHFLISDYVPRPRPGAVVFVPTKEKHEVGGPSLLTILATTASVIASLATVLIAAKH